MTEKPTDQNPKPTRYQLFWTHPLVSRILTPRERRRNIRKTLDEITEKKKADELDAYAQTIQDLYVPGTQWNRSELPDQVPTVVRMAFHDGMARRDYIEAKKDPRRVQRMHRAIALFQKLGLKELERAAWNDYPRCIKTQGGIHQIWWVSGGLGLLEQSLLPKHERNEIRETLAAWHHELVANPHHLVFSLDSAPGLHYLTNDLDIQTQSQNASRINAALVRLVWLC